MERKHPTERDGILRSGAGPKPRVVGAIVIAVALAMLAFWRFAPSTTEGVPPGGLATGRDVHGRDLAQAADKVVVASTLGQRRDPGSVPYLIPLLKDPNPKVRAGVAEALQAIADPASATPLLQQLETESDPWTATALIRALGALNLREAAPALLKRLGDPSPMVRLAAVDTMGRSSSSNAIAGLARLTSDTNNSVRANAADRLVAIGEPAIPAILEVMGEGSDLARIYRIAALGRIQSPETVPALIKVLRAHDPCIAGDRYPPKDGPVRVAILDALAGAGEPAAVAVASEATGKAGDLAFKSMAACLFLRLQSPAGIHAVTRRLLGWKTVVSEQEWEIWTGMLAGIDTPEAKESLDRLRKHRDSLPRQAAPGQ